MLLNLIFLLQLCSVFGSNYTVGRSCPAGTFSSKFDNKWCYTFVDTPETFKVAEKDCFQRGGHLAQISDQPLNKFLKTQVKKLLEYGVEYWIGARSAQIQDSNYNNVWTWADHSLITYFNWNKDQSQASWSSGEQKCVAATIVDGKWSAENCSAEMPYLCQIPSAISVCEPGWTLNDKIYKCFKAFTQKSINHPDSETQCQDQGGHLASIHSQEENDFIGDLTSLSFKGDYTLVGIWIGAVSDTTQTWSWTDKSANSYNNFGVHDPVKENSLCAMMYPDGMSWGGYGDYIKQWDSSKCDVKINRFICQKDPLFVNP